MPEAVFRIAFYAIPLIGVYVALRTARGRPRWTAFGMVACVVPGVSLLLGSVLQAASWWLPPQMAETEISSFRWSWFLSTTGLAGLAGLGVGAVRSTEAPARIKVGGPESGGHDV